MKKIALVLIILLVVFLGVLMREKQKSDWEIINTSTYLFNQDVHKKSEALLKTKRYESYVSGDTVHLDMRGIDIIAIKK
jgi:hypothetical protein